MVSYPWPSEPHCSGSSSKLTPHHSTPIFYTEFLVKPPSSILTVLIWGHGTSIIDSKCAAGDKRKVHLLTYCHPTMVNLISQACPNLTPLLKVLEDLDLGEGAWRQP